MLELELNFDSELYSADAVQRAVYRFSDRLSADLVGDGSALRCLLHIDVERSEEAEVIAAEFRNEVLDQTLRERIRAETAEVRNLILALAFSQTGLTESE